MLRKRVEFMDITIIYINYKTGPLIIDSITTVKKWTTGITYEIIVVDNNSGDNSLISIKNKFPEVICIQSSENVGFGRANNIAIDKSKGKCLFLLNPDTLLQNNAIKILYDYLSTNSHVGACGGNLVDESLQPTFSFGRRFPNLLQDFLSIFYLKPLYLPYIKSQYYNFTNHPISVDSVVGADLMIKKELINIVGGFDPDFFMNFEETELCFRIKKSGHKIMSVPSAKIIHLEGKSEYVNISRMQFYMKGKYIYFEKTHGNKYLKKLFRIVNLKCIVRIIIFNILRNKERINYWVQQKKLNKNVYLMHKA